MHKYILELVFIFLLLGCAKSYYGYEKDTWENMSNKEQSEVIDEINNRLQDSSENAEFNKDVESITGWAGKHRNSP